MVNVAVEVLMSDGHDGDGGGGGGGGGEWMVCMAVTVMVVVVVVVGGSRINERDSMVVHLRARA
jgi:hypothetical protein